MAKPSFVNLWKAYSDLLITYPDAKPCDGPWANQCAIRMSMTLNAELTIKVNKSTYTEPKCAHEHARGAESLANWLSMEVSKVAHSAGCMTGGMDQKNFVAHFSW